MLIRVHHLLRGCLHFHCFRYVHCAFCLNGANLYCGNGVTCNIECRGYGCHNISSMTGSGTYAVDCTYNLGTNVACDNSAANDYALSTLDFRNLPNILQTDFLFSFILLSTIFCRNTTTKCMTMIFYEKKI